MVKHTSWVDDVQGWTDIQNPIETTKKALDSAGLIGKNVGYDEQAWFYNHRPPQGPRRGVRHDELRGDGGPCGSRASGEVSEGDRVTSEKPPRPARPPCRAASTPSKKALNRERRRSRRLLPVHKGRKRIPRPRHAGRHRIPRRSRVHHLGTQTPSTAATCLYLEMGGSYRRYNACLSRGVVVGEPSDQAKAPRRRFARRPGAGHRGHAAGRILGIRGQGRHGDTWKASAYPSTSSTAAATSSVSASHPTGAKAAS